MIDEQDKLKSEKRAIREALRERRMEELMAAADADAGNWLKGDSNG